MGSFQTWLKNNGYSQSYIDYLLRCAKSILSGKNVFSFRSQNYLACLSALAKFTGQYQQFKEYLKNHGIVWKRRDRHYFFSLLYNRNQLVDEMLQWMEKVRHSDIGQDAWFTLVFLAYTGIRPSEAFNLFKLASQGRIMDIWNPELGCLETWKLPDVFLRMSKKLFIVPLSPQMLNLLRTFNSNITYNALAKRLKKKNIPIHIYNLRKLHGTILRMNGLQTEEIDLLQGRIAESLFVKHYLALNLKDLCTRAIRILEPYLQNWLTLEDTENANIIDNLKENHYIREQIIEYAGNRHEETN